MFFGAPRVRTGVAPESVSTVTECASGVEIATAAVAVDGVVIDSTSSCPWLYRMFRSSSALSSSAIIFPLLVGTERGARLLPLVPSATSSTRCAPYAVPPSTVLRGGPARTSPAPLPERVIANQTGHKG